MNAEPDPASAAAGSSAGSSPPGRTRLLHPVDWAEASGASGEVVRALERRLARRRQRRLAAGAALAVALAALAWWQPDRLRTAPATVGAAPATLVVNAPIRRTLEDGTIAESRPGAEFEVAFTPAVRRVVLRTGAVHFAVAKNPARPFVVAAGGVEVRAVGTAFAVHVDPHAVNVVVTEGTVALERPPAAAASTPAAGPPPTPLLLDAGASATVGASPPALAAVPSTPAPPEITRLTPTEIAARLAWRVPTIEFSGTALAAVVPVINRHANAQLVIADPALGDIRLSGVLRADNLETLLRLLEDEHGVRAARGPDNTITLRRAP